MKTHRFTIVMAAAAALSLTACNKGADNTAEPKDNTEAATPAAEETPAAAVEATPAETPAPTEAAAPVATPAEAAAPAPADAASSAPAAAPAAAADAGKEVTLPGGTVYVDEIVGTGQEAKTGDTVVVHYTGTLNDGTKFDSSLDRNEPFSFPLGGRQVIAGWDEGIVGMKVGGKRKLKIPADQAYGDRQMGPIPPNSPLNFDVELLAIK